MLSIIMKMIQIGKVVC